MAFQFTHGVDIWIYSKQHLQSWHLAVTLIQSGYITSHCSEFRQHHQFMLRRTDQSYPIIPVIRRPKVREDLKSAAMCAEQC